MAKLFTLQEAEELIPSLEEWLPEAIDAKKQAVEADGELRKIIARIQVMGGVELNPGHVNRSNTPRNKLSRNSRTRWNISRIPDAWSKTSTSA
jgi:hypothetical protein